MIKLSRTSLNSAVAFISSCIGTPMRLAATAAIVGTGIAVILIPSAGGTHAAILVATLLLTLGLLYSLGERGYADSVAAVIVIGFLIAASAVWAVNGHAMVTRDVGESYSIYLNGHNISNLVTFFVTDHAPGGDPAAHPFFYIHHPNLPARVISKLAQLAGIGIEDQVFLNILLGGVTLVIAYIGLSRAVSRPFALAAIAFLAVSYGIFYESMSDLARGVHYTLFFALFLVLTLNPKLNRTSLNVAVAVLIVLLALSDFAIFIFASAFAIAWITYRNGAILWRSILLLIVLPASGALAFYLAMVIYAVGWNFFLFDLIYTYLGRAGQFVGAHEKFLGAITPEQTREAYRDHNVVLWARPVQEWGIRDIWNGWHPSLQFSIGRLTVPVEVTVAVALVVFIAAWRKGAIAALVLAAIVGISWFKLTMPLILLLPLFALIWMVSRDSERIAAWLGPRDSSLGRVRWPLMDASAFIAVVIVALLATAALFPEYAVNFLLLGKRPPSPFLEMAAFGWFAVLLTLVPTRMGIEGVTIRQNLAPVLAAVPIVIVAIHNINVYRQHRPSAPPYATLLSEPRFHDASFLATGYYGVVWYYTRGWTNMSESGNPPRSLGYNVNLLHVADWRNRAKYSRPQYFLCDNSQYRSSLVQMPAPAACIVPNACDCRDIANYFAAKGHTIVHSEPLFSILAINHDVPLGETP